MIGAIVSLGRNSCGGGGGVGSDLLLHGLNDAAFDDVHTDHHLDKEDDDDVSISVDDLLLTPQVSINLILLMAAFYIGYYDQIIITAAADEFIGTFHFAGMKGTSLCVLDFKGFFFNLTTYLNSTADPVCRVSSIFSMQQPRYNGKQVMDSKNFFKFFASNTKKS